MPSEAVDGAFNNSIRETIGAHLDYDLLHDRVGTELCRCINDSNVVLGRAPAPEKDRLVRSTMQASNATDNGVSMYVSKADDPGVLSQEGNVPFTCVS
ncbi:hypothetical protein D1007_15936 [Hordeum vulgare]|nr:hypothetical protein D1007_15936 [Hordeum vulgare]